MASCVRVAGVDLCRDLVSAGRCVEVCCGRMQHICEIIDLVLTEKYALVFFVWREGGGVLQVEDTREKRRRHLNNNYLYSGKTRPRLLTVIQDGPGAFWIFVQVHE